MPQFKKKPVVIDAWQFNADREMPPAWLAERILEGKVYYQGGDKPYLTIETLEGNMRADKGDWIIRGVKGELYPCKPDIFEVTYDAVTE
jgi:hypothetical protein